MNEDRKNTPANENLQETLPEEALLTAYALGELSADEAAQVESRLANDESLQKEVQEIRRFGQWLTDALENEPIETNPPAKVPETTPGSASPTKRFHSRRTYATLAAAVVLLACVSVLWLTGYPSHLPQHVAIESTKYEQAITEKRLAEGNSKVLQNVPVKQFQAIRPLADAEMSMATEMAEEAEEAETVEMAEMADEAAAPMDAETTQSAAPEETAMLGTAPLEDRAMETSQTESLPMDAAPRNAAMRQDDIHAFSDLQKADTAPAPTPAQAPAPAPAMDSPAQTAPESAMDTWYGLSEAEDADADVAHDKMDGVAFDAMKGARNTPDEIHEAASLAPAASQRVPTAQNSVAREAASELQNEVPAKTEQRNIAASKEMAPKAGGSAFQSDSAVPSAAAPAMDHTAKAARVMPDAPQAEKFAAAAISPRSEAAFQKIADHPTVSLELKRPTPHALNTKFSARRSSDAEKPNSHALGSRTFSLESRKLKSPQSLKWDRERKPTDAAPAVEESAFIPAPAAPAPELALEPAEEPTFAPAAAAPTPEAPAPEPAFAASEAASLAPSTLELAQQEEQRLCHLLLERYRLPTRNQIHTAELLRYFTENVESPQAGDAPTLNIEIHPHPGKPALYLAKVTLHHAEKLAVTNVLLNLRFQPEHVAGCRRLGGVPTLGDTTTLLYEIQPVKTPSPNAPAAWLSAELDTPEAQITSVSGQPNVPEKPSADFQLAAAVSLFVSALYGDLPPAETLATVQELCGTIPPTSEATRAKLRELQELVQAAQELVR